ncbi:hypothetical protein FGSG_10569 [Fusarium graminearum PH-1]|uniref:Chromosome 1, complete genome n=1 Tax=Gibberella zeae (strain ATCC MYA-4620 / CBS 123657 / FGSC 9075 / NRRL 31084 / PH-1) TaxID=229533 RepID=I1S1G8_GIBZE|nr:hypothetical protein FGSG_10569 [Fusarium graminearum PH-1]ESU17305.1 hypothetical protein FGSG_10569 [Fusarium graminearum PH-1]CEF76018.1 unnamed protein product [Fusarium graminearum]|eukprot:XP_011319567.1 hypothetical protein FGSG_10569 [Fusarium graminearum PH-1]
MSSSVSQISPSAGGTQARIGPDPVFDKAVAKFKKRLTKDQAAKFANCTVDDVRDQIRDIQNRHGAQRRLRNMERISKFVEGMVQLGTVVEVFLNLHNTVALIWGPIKFLLVTASTWIDTVDSLLDVYGQIGEILPDLTRNRQIYKEYPSVHTHLEAYYCDILQFHSNALDVFARPGWKVLFHFAWKTFKTQFDPILKSLERHRVMLSEEKLTAVMQETQKQGQSIQDKLHQLNRDLQERDKKDAERDLITRQSQIDQQFRSIESKIDAPNYHEDYEIASQKRFQNTSGQWILSHPLVSEWLNHSSKADGKIYLSGIPGAGKTVLTSSLITHLNELKASAKDSGDRFTISYFYFKHDQPKKNSFVSLLLSLLAQLVAQDESLLDHIYHARHSMDSQQFRSLDESRCFVIIDALDECPEAPKVLQWFENVIFKQDGTPGDTDFNIRLLISGQRDGILESQMSHYKMIHLDMSPGHDQDIKKYAAAMTSKIRDKFSLDLNYEQEIVSRVTSHACGMFLYAQLVLTNLISQTSKYDFKQEMKAETFPDGLEQAYDRIIVRVLRNPNKSERAVAKHILGMIICAFRPLHWRELKSKLCIDPTKSEVDIDRELVVSCKQICNSLVDVSYIDPSLSLPGEEIIDLVHSSAKTYLVQTKEIDVPTENAQMALFCTEYMLSRPLTPGLSKHDIHNYANKGYYGFHDYAVAFWWKHVQQVLVASQLAADLVRSAMQAAYRCVIDIGELDQTGDFDDSIFDIQNVKSKLKHVPQSLQDWNTIKIYEMRAVTIRDAIEVQINHFYEHKQAALALYGPWRYKCRKPWCQYFSRGFEKAQQQQIHINQHELPFTCEHPGCFATEVGFEKETDLKTHARRWHPKEEQLLFPTSRRPGTKQLGVSPDYQKKGGHSLLETAIRNGHLHVVQYLTEMGANVNMKTWKDARPLNLLDEAVARCDLEIITFLCSLDSFSLAVHALLSSGKSDPNAHGLLRQLPLHLACEIGTLPIVQRLYAATTTTDIEDTSGNTPLHIASMGGHYAVVDFLIKEGADINALNQTSETPLHLAIIGFEGAYDPFFSKDGLDLAKSLDSGNILGGFNFDDSLNDHGGYEGILASQK